MTAEEQRAAANLLRGLRQVGDDLTRIHTAIGESLRLADALLTRAERALGLAPPPANPPPAA